MADMIGNPFVLFGMSISTSIVLLAYTKPRSSLRSIGTILMLAYIGIILVAPTQEAEFTHPMYPRLAGGSVLNLALRYIGFLVQGWDYDAQGPTTTVEGKPLVPQNSRDNKINTQDSRLLWAAKTVYNGRFSGTPFEVRNVPPFDPRNPSRIPSKSEFLIKNTTRCMITGILLDMISMAGKDTSRNAVLFAENKVPFFSRLGEITSEDIAIRIMSSLIASTVTYLLFQFLYSGGAVLTVGLGLGHVQEWRPLFGEFTEIWSLRNTWNKFWHQGMGTSLRVPAHFITVKILRLPKHSLFGGYAYALLVFGLSGLVHVVGDIASGMKFRETSVMHWFLIQALGFVLEDLFIAIYRKITGTRNRHPKNIPTWQKAVGFAWVFSWMLWTLPAWNYPIARKSEGEGVLPFSIVEFLVSGR